MPPGGRWPHQGWTGPGVLIISYGWGFQAGASLRALQTLWVENIAVGMPVTRHPPGSRAGLLPPSPLRTTRASFPACRSSLANAPLRTRFHDGQSLAMDLGMTVWMKQHTVFHTVRTAMRAPHQVMAMPSSQLRDALLTDRTEAVLLLPQANQVSPSPQVVRHTHAQTGF